MSDLTYQDQKFLTDKTLKFVTDEWNRIKNQCNDVRQINILADAERNSKRLVEELGIEDIKYKISVLSEIVHDRTINAGEVEVLKQQTESIGEKL